MPVPKPQVEMEIFQSGSSGHQRSFLKSTSAECSVISIMHVCESYIF